MKLHVEGTKLKNEAGEVVQLRGVSSHGLQWYPEYINKDAFRTLRDDWKANVIRLAMYTAEGGFLDGANQEDQYSIIDRGVKCATELGMYVIIDWHILADNNPNDHISEAKAFFDRVSKTYADHTNVLYEICNEPNGDVSWLEVKEYADVITPVIRANDRNAVIIIGTTTWSQDVDLCAANPVKDTHNIMYVCHFYAASHKEKLRQKVETALADGIPIFISEFSICDASGNGGIDYDSAAKWVELIDRHQLSFIGWNLSNRDESSAVLLPNCTKLSDWEESDLNETGIWLRNTLRSHSK